MDERLERLQYEAEDAAKEADTMKGLPNEISQQEGYAAGLERAYDLMSAAPRSDEVIDHHHEENHVLWASVGALGNLLKTMPDNDFLIKLIADLQVVAHERREDYEAWFEQQCDTSQATRDATAAERARCMNIVRDHWGGYSDASVYDSLMECMRNG